jgi:hypothetical protein
MESANYKRLDSTALTSMDVPQEAENGWVLNAQDRNS